MKVAQKRIVNKYINDIAFMNKVWLIFFFIYCVGHTQSRVLITELNSSGNFMDDFSTLYYQGELFNGLAYEVYANGKLWVEAKYKNGRCDGELKEWDQQGRLRLVENYKNGDKDGVQKYYWESSGRLLDESNWKKGKLHGLSRTWHESGQLLIEENYITGRLISEKCWNDNGEKIQCRDLEWRPRLH